ncbi:MAG: hypothetical protein QXD43_05315 [Candidatus Aenigmatarchaeota archaeon]
MNKIRKLIFKKLFRSGWAGRKEGWEKRIPSLPSLSAAEFRILIRKMRRQ